MVTLDASLAEVIKDDWRKAELDDRDRVMLAYVEKLTLSPATCTREDLASLAAAGFDEVAISQIVMIAGVFSHLNRVADALGVGRG